MQTHLNRVNDFTGILFRVSMEQLTSSIQIQFDEIDSTMREIAFLPLGSQETPKKMFIGTRTPTMVPTLDPKSQLDD